MRNTILISLLVLSINKLPNNKPLVIQTENHYCFSSIDTSKYAIIKFDKQQPYIFDKSDEPATLSDDDITQMEKLINKTVNEYNKSKKKGIYPLLISHPEKYYKQFVAVINTKGE